jgi:hypothetical protein
MSEDVKKKDIESLMITVDRAQSEKRITSLQATKLRNLIDDPPCWYSLASYLLSELMYGFQLHNRHTSFLKFDFGGLLRSEHHRTKKPNKNMKALRFKLRREYKCQRIDTCYRNADSDSSVSPWRDRNSDSEDSLAPSDSDCSSADFYPPKCFKSNKKKEQKIDVNKNQKRQKKEDSKNNQKKQGKGKMN